MPRRACPAAACSPRAAPRSRSAEELAELSTAATARRPPCPRRARTRARGYDVARQAASGRARCTARARAAARAARRGRAAGGSARAHAAKLRAALGAGGDGGGGGDDGGDDGALRAWVAETAFRSPEWVLQWQYAAAYVPERGFGVAVDGIVQLPRAAAKKALFKVVFSLVTPERHLFYAEPPMTGGAEFTIAHELGSHRESPRFADAMKIFREEDYHASLAVVFEVRGVERAKGDQLDVPPAARGYWACLPVFRAADAARERVASGTYRPLFEGAPPKGLLEADDAYAYICEHARDAGSRPAKGESGAGDCAARVGGALIVRLADAQLADAPSSTSPRGSTTRSPTSGGSRRCASACASRGSATTGSTGPTRASRTPRRASVRRRADQAGRAR